MTSEFYKYDNLLQSVDRRMTLQVVIRKGPVRVLIAANSVIPRPEKFAVLVAFVEISLWIFGHILIASIAETQIQVFFFLDIN